MKKHLCYAAGGFCLGVLLTSLLWMCVGLCSAASDASPETSAAQQFSVSQQSSSQQQTSVPQQTSAPQQTTESSRAAASWNSTSVYLGGDTVSCQGRQYRAKWWT